MSSMSMQAMMADHDHDSMVNSYNHSCPSEGTFPTIEQLQLGMGVSGTAGLYVSSLLVCGVNCGMFIVLIRKFIKEVPERQVRRKHIVNFITPGRTCSSLYWFTSNINNRLFLKLFTPSFTQLKSMSRYQTCAG